MISRRVPGLLLAAALLAACSLVTPATPTPAPTATPVTPSPTASAEPTASVEPTASPEPSFSLDVPEGVDPRTITVSVATDLDDDAGELVVTVANLTDQRVDELVLRWSADLNDVLFLAPFVPSAERIREGGAPLVQDWTKWVVGPGERGEPAGTISLGYGPLMPGATLAMALHAERHVAVPVEFDLHVLAGNDILTLDGGGLAALRVGVP